MKQLKKSFTASLSIRKSQGSVTKQAQPDPVHTLGGGRCAHCSLLTMIRAAPRMWRRAQSGWDKKCSMTALS